MHSESDFFLDPPTRVCRASWFPLLFTSKIRQCKTRQLIWSMMIIWSKWVFLWPRDLSIKQIVVSEQSLSGPFAKVQGDWVTGNKCVHVGCPVRRNGLHKLVRYGLCTLHRGSGSRWFVRNIHPYTIVCVFSKLYTCEIRSEYIKDWSLNSVDTSTFFLHFSRIITITSYFCRVCDRRYLEVGWRD